MEDEQSISPSFKNKLKQTLCLSCCFRNSRRETLGSSSSSSTTSTSSDDRPTLVRAPSMWLKSRVHELPEIGDKCRHLINRIGRHHHHHRRHSSSADFRYDPLSYALNFDDSHVDEAPLQNFSARVPASPPPVDADGLAKPAAIPREIACV
ncbi:Interleukin-2 receptor subunit beta like [Actinidia chinensis var. chinensis]|uniref:Interleukin-2 receptor subunit beta like n=1 Tax=Actinidia chinensis var. chinensis TaxID=1590841 RepID=A0A2R6QHS8_ACTCC|nr:Interleukin-2 receptor subunit beta like [Actinidia chinensis var. chinensis]PSS08166.1 Interleukin-2 receptor subunit beta like [Actinidia chinensis var. chinensis]